MLRQHVKYTGPIEIFGDSEDAVATCEKMASGMSVSCRKLSKKPAVGFAAKLLALLDSSFDDSLMMGRSSLSSF